MTIHNTRAQPAGSAVPLRDPGYQAFLLLRTVFTLAPIAFGIDKFFNVLTDWEGLSCVPQINDLVPGSAHQAMLMIGGVEIFAGLLVAVRPQIGGYVVAAWLAGHHRQPC